MIDLKEMKLYLRVDGNEEDTLITSLIATAEELVESITRQKLTAFEEIPETLRQAVMFVVATLYEQRQGGKGGLNMKDTLDVVKRMTFAYRKEAW